MTAKDMIEHFDVKGRQKNEFLSAAKRLENVAF